MPEKDFGIGERRDGRVLASTLTCPGIQKWSQDRDVGMQCGHPADADPRPIRRRGVRTAARAAVVGGGPVADVAGARTGVRNSALGTACPEPQHRHRSRPRRSDRPAGARGLGRGHCPTRDGVALQHHAGYSPVNCGNSLANATTTPACRCRSTACRPFCGMAKALSDVPAVGCGR